MESIQKHSFGAGSRARRIVHQGRSRRKRPHQSVLRARALSRARALDGTIYKKALPSMSFATRKCTECGNWYNPTGYSQKRCAKCIPIYRKIYIKQWSKNNPEKERKYYIKKHINLRALILEAYGGKTPKCVCCGENDKRFLTIDHINGGGSKHKKEIKNNLYRWLKINNFPEGFQILCYNCNQVKYIYGKCPHKR